MYVQGDGELVVCEGGGEGQMERGELKNLSYAICYNILCLCHTTLL